MRHAAVALIAILLSAAPEAASASATQQFVDVRQVATDTLRDVAVTIVSAGRPTIYYSPARMQELGPAFSAFVMAHEYGHVRYGHAGGALGAITSTDTELRVRQELEADCYAARILTETNPSAVTAAAQFFTRMGPFRFDRVHPGGTQRVAMIQSCLALPEPAPRGREAGAR
jgi:hypothetical protein